MRNREIAAHGGCNLFLRPKSKERATNTAFRWGYGVDSKHRECSHSRQNACWGVPQTPKKRGETMTNRTQKIVLRVPVTPEEQELIRQKMALLHTRNFSAYARKMLIDGYVVHIDTTDIRAQTAELQKIGVNVNQIARRLNSMGPLYTQDVADIKGALAQIWQLQRYILSSQR